MLRFTCRCYPRSMRLTYSFNASRYRQTSRSKISLKCSLELKYLTLGTEISCRFGGERCRPTPKFINCYFYSNLASSHGGALYIKDGNPQFDNCIFFSNAANAGGAVYIRGGLPEFNNCSFYSNAAQLGGGAVVINGGRVTMRHCKFEINVATRAGGALSVLSGSLEVLESSIISNYAGEADGGVFIGQFPSRFHNK